MTRFLDWVYSVPPYKDAAALILVAIAVLVLVAAWKIFDLEGGQ